jgi:hypothetical protein
MRHRRRLSAGLYAFLVARVSARALIIFEPTFGSLAHVGTRPQWKASTRRTPPSDSTAYTSLVGATL